MKKEYTNGEVTVVWQPDLCIHSAKCVTGLPDVFDNRRKPWIKPDAATTEAIIAQVNTCPSGALSTYLNSVQPDSAEKSPDVAGIRAVVLKNGPLMVHGEITVCDADGNEVTKGPKTTFCRCGGSANKPFCDGSHKRNGFEG
jgi:uncharacterized Fe-S cluster protein YjdI